jgi:FKBP-type peptidyl-prolyl cis-trans isomerase
MSKAFPYVLLGSILLIIFGVYSSVSSTSQTVYSQKEQLTETQPDPTITTAPMKDFEKLEIEDMEVGTGAEVKTGDTVVIHYFGTLVDGTKFDSSYDRGQPFETQIGVGRVIAGWDQGVVGMKVGGKRRLQIPSALAYGSRGAGGVIGPNAPLIFELELLEVK